MNSPEPTQESVSLIFETSPYGNVDAIVEHDGRAVFFYLNGSDFGTRACWVRNLLPGPYVINVDELKQGIPPLLPRTHCKYSDGRPCPEADSLSIVWMEEGNGAALFEFDQLLAVIPPWSGQPAPREDGAKDVFHGYAAECAAENQICWPLPDHPQLIQRINQARSFWNQFSNDSGDSNDADDSEASAETKNENPFFRLQPRILEVLDQRFLADSTQPHRYFAIDGGRFPSRGMVQYQNQTHMTLATVGMSMCPQPNVELHSENPALYRRVELALQLPTETDAETVSSIQDRFSAIASYPWRKFSWYGPGHSVELLAEHKDFEFALLTHDVFIADSNRVTVSETQQFPTIQGDPVNLLWLIAISGKERSALENRTSTPAEILTQDRLPKVC